MAVAQSPDEDAAQGVRFEEFSIVGTQVLPP